MKLTKRIIAAALVCCQLLIYSGCSKDDGSGGIFKYDISYDPSSLDPQTASDACSDMIISCMYTGLLTLNPDGSLGEGAAEDYVVSEDGTVYTFKLREDIYWLDKGDFEAQCTAHDFVFAFQRLFDPATRAPRASEYYSIKNSELVNRGIVPDVSQIGVKALGDFELEITLSTPNPQFPMLLTQTPAMPCNEEYFLLSQGKYGLSADTTPSNGAFYITTWDYDPYTITDNNHIILRRNAKTSERSQVYPYGLNFFIVDESRFVSDFVGGTTSCIAVTDEQAKIIADDELTVESFSSISVGLVFNCKYDIFKNADFRCALASLADRERLAGVLSDYTLSEGVVPDEVTLLDKGYREYAGGGMTMEYDAEKALHYYSLCEEQLNKQQLVGARLILPDDTMLDAVSYIMQEWQKYLGFYCKIEVLPEEEYNKRLSSGDYELAVMELSGGYNSPEAYLKPFTRNGENHTGYFDVAFEKLIKQASTAVELSDSADLYIEAEKLLLDNAGFVPLCYKNEYFFITEEASDIYYNPYTKTIDFSEAKIK